MLKKSTTTQEMEDLKKVAFTTYSNPELFKTLLENQLGLNEYSPTNRLYLFNQDKTVKYVASFNKWKSLGFPVKEKGCLYVFYPIFTKGFYDEHHKWKKLSEATTKEKSLLKSKKLKTQDWLYNYGKTPVFDISKTTATEKDLITILSDKKKELKKLSEIKDSLASATGYSSNANSLNEQIYEIVKHYISTYVNENYDTELDFISSEINTSYDSLKDLLIESDTYLILKQCQMNNILFDYNLVNAVTWDDSKLDVLLKFNQILLNTSDKIFDSLLGELYYAR